MKYGLTPGDIETIQGILAKNPEIQEVWLFGSRATGNHHAGSDVDLAVMNEGISNKTIRQVLSDIEDSTLPFFVDIVNFPDLKHPALKDHINQVGQLLYSNVSFPVINEPKTGYTRYDVK